MQRRHVYDVRAEAGRFTRSMVYGGDVEWAADWISERLDGDWGALVGQHELPNATASRRMWRRRVYLSMYYRAFCVCDPVRGCEETEAVESGALERC